MKNTQIIDKNSKYIVSAAEMKRCDECTINHFKVPQEVLMERAALSLCALCLEKAGKNGRITVFAGSGNNGGDGIAAARLLHQEGCDVLLVLVNHRSGKLTDACKLQLEIAENYGVDFVYFDQMIDARRVKNCDIIVDAMLGIGCSRELSGEYRKAAEVINEASDSDRDRHPIVIAADIPTGINADTGEICGTAVRADFTVTFGFMKLGHKLFPGSEYAGKISIESVGITKDGFLEDYPEIRYIDVLDEKKISKDGTGKIKASGKIKALLPKRNPSGNKGSFGKVLIVAGSKKVSGAMIMAAETALRSGAGMVKIFTEKENLHSVQTLLPEAMIEVYDSDELGAEISGSAKSCDSSEGYVSEVSDSLKKSVDWCDVIVCGPGIGTDECASFLVRTVLEYAGKKLVLDADALNVIAADEELRSAFKEYEAEKIITPHLAEFARLAGKSVAECKRDILTLPKALAKEFHASIICKDARSIITDGSHIFINLSGNDGMATAGSGDVLSGLLGALVCLPFENSYEATVVSCYIHGRAGDLAAEKLGKNVMTARDISEALKGIFA